MPQPSGLIFDPIIIRYDGLDAEDHRIDLALLGRSLRGASRLLGVAGHIVSTGIYVSKVPAMSVRVLAAVPQANCVEIPVYVQSLLPLLPLLSDVGRDYAKKAVVAIVRYIFVRNTGSPEEVEMAMNVALAAVAANEAVSLKSLDVALAVVRAGEDQRPAARDFASPVAQSVVTAMIGDRREAFVVDAAAKGLIEGSKTAVEIGPAQPFIVLVTELDIETGECKVKIQGVEVDRVDGDIADPVVANPRSPYSTALDGQYWITVMAKPHIRDGRIEKLTISDTVDHVERGA